MTKGTRTFPWRVIGIAANDGDLITNPLVWLLEKPSQVAGHLVDQAGQGGVGLVECQQPLRRRFQVAASTPQTYKYYIDFAARYGLEYIILDEGWYKLGNVLEVVPAINMPKS